MLENPFGSDSESKETGSEDVSEEPADESSYPPVADGVFEVVDSGDRFSWVESERKNTGERVAFRLGHSKVPCEDGGKMSIDEFDVGDHVGLQLELSNSNCHPEIWITTGMDRDPDNPVEMEVTSVDGVERLLPSAYDVSQKQYYEFSSQVTISPIKDEFVEINIALPSGNISIEVRVENFTTRFGKVNAQEISVGNAVDVYYDTGGHDSDDRFLHRRLFYNSEGVSSVHQDTVSSLPVESDWTRPDNSSSKSTTEIDTPQLTVLTQGEILGRKNETVVAGGHIMEQGEVILQYTDNASQEFIHRFNADEFCLPTRERLSPEFIAVNDDLSEINLYCQTKVDCRDNYVISYPMFEQSNPVASEYQPLSVDEYPSPYTVQNVVWVRHPADTWSIIGKERTL